MTQRAVSSGISHKARVRALLASTALVATNFGNLAHAQALPDGGAVSAGSATIGAATNNGLVINQTSANAVINWQSYNIGGGNIVTYVQPDALSAILNRVTGSTTTSIARSAQIPMARSISSTPMALPSPRLARSILAPSWRRHCAYPTRTSWRGSAALPAMALRLPLPIPARLPSSAVAIWR
nr:hypothetical protein [Devosia psychrophila]